MNMMSAMEYKGRVRFKIQIRTQTQDMEGTDKLTFIAEHSEPQGVNPPNPPYLQIQKDYVWTLS